MKKEIEGCRKCECCGTEKKYYCKNALNYPVLCVSCSLYTKTLRRKINYLKRKTMMLEKKLYGIKYGGASLRDKKLIKLLK